MKINNWQQAVTVLANGTDVNDEAAAYIVNNLSYPGEGDPQVDVSVFDWVINGDWRGSETLAGIQAELMETFDNAR